MLFPSFLLPAREQSKRQKTRCKLSCGADPDPLFADSTGTRDRTGRHKKTTGIFWPENTKRAKLCFNFPSPNTKKKQGREIKMTSLNLHWVTGLRSKKRDVGNLRRPLVTHKRSPRFAHPPTWISWGWVLVVCYDCALACLIMM